MANYHTLLEQLRKDEAEKAHLFDKSIDNERPSEQFISDNAGPQRSDQDLKWDALKKTNDKVLALADQQYYKGLQGERPKTAQEQHFDKVLDRYADKFKNHKPEFNEQGREENNRDNEQQR